MPEYQRAGEAGWRGEDRFRTAFAHAAVGVAVSDADGRFLEVNPAYCRITGYSEDELLALDILALTHPDDRPGNADLIRRLSAGPEPGFVLEKRYVRKDGAVVWVKVSGSLVRDDQGRPHRLIALIEDVTERKSSEDRLRASEEQTRLLLDSTGEAIYGIDTEGRCTFTNPACLRLLGYDRPEDLLGRNMHLLIHHTRPDGSPYPADECRISRAFLRGEGTHADDEVLWRADGTAFPAEYRSYPVRRGGEVVGSVVTFTDVTDRQRAEATIAEQVRLAEYGGEVGRALTQGGTPEEVLARCAAATVRHLDGAFARIWTVNEAGDVLELQASAGMYTHTDGPHARVPVGRFKIGQIARDRKPHLTNAVIGDPLVPAQEWAEREGMVAFAGYPLVVADRLVGVLAVFARHALSGAALRMMGSVADEIAVGIERERAEARLHRQREWLRVTLASIGDAVIATDTGGRVTFLNGVAEALTGWSQGDAAGVPLAEVFRIVNERTGREVESPAGRALREGAIVGLANHTILIARDGTRRAIDDSAAPIRDESGAVMGAVLIFRDVDEKRRSERELEASEERLRLALEAGRMGTWAWDVRANTVAWSPGMERIHGLEPGTFPGTFEADQADIHPEDRGRVGAAIARTLEQGAEHHVEYRLALPDGRTPWVEARGRLYRDEDGRPARLVGVCTDVTERKEAEGRLAEQTRIAEALNRIGILLAAEHDLERLVQVVTDEATRLTRARFGAFFYNASDGRGGAYTLYTLSGAPREEFSRFPMPRATDLFAPTFRGEGPVRLADVTLDPRFGKNHPHEGMPRGHLPVKSYLAVPVVSRSGAVLGGLFFGHPDPAVFTDADERLAVGIAAQAAVALDNAELVGALREADRAKGELLDSLRDSEGRFRTMAESIPQLAWMARPDGHIYWYNKRWHDYTGTTPEEMQGWGWQSVHDPAVLPAVTERWRASIASGEPFDMVFPLKGADGGYRPFLTRVAPVRGEDGRIAHWFGTNTDVADRLRVEEELRAAKEDAEAANRAKSQFLAVLSHELRTPLNPILLAASSMLERPAAPEDFRPTLEMIRQNVHLQARLIDDLLDVMRIVRGKMPLHWEVADCHALIRQALQMCQSEIFGKELRLELDLGARDHFLNADPARFQQVVWNLVKNAVKFTPGGGVITIRTRNPRPGGGRDDHLVIEVTDTGIGIEADVLPLIFDPFQQGETRITRKFGGLGLGLAICRGIVEAHGGALTVESPGKDRGTLFRVVLKTIPSPASAPGEPAGVPPAAPAPPSSLRILAVEDEPATLRLMARLLRGLGHTVTTAHSIASGFAAFEAGAFDLIVSDIGLPDGSGLELMRRVVALRGRTAAIALTGYGMEEDIQKSREAGFTAHMTKPIDFTKLEAMIAQVAAARPGPGAAR